MLPSEQEIKIAIEVLNKHYNPPIKTLIDLTQEFLNAKTEMPKKLTEIEFPEYYARGYNTALDKATLCHMKIMEKLVAENDELQLQLSGEKIRFENLVDDYKELKKQTEQLNKLL